MAERKQVLALAAALKPFLLLRASIPLPYVTTFLQVALDQGKGVNEYARAAGLDPRIVSRYFRDIGGRSRSGGPGLGLVEVRSHPTEKLKKQVFLSKKGRNIVDYVERTSFLR